MDSIEYFLNRCLSNAYNLQNLAEQLEQIVAVMAREQRLETAPVCADLAMSMMCRGSARREIL